jgi:hypothetical protein
VFDLTKIDKSLILTVTTTHVVSPDHLSDLRATYESMHTLSFDSSRTTNGRVPTVKMLRGRYSLDLKDAVDLTDRLAKDYNWVLADKIFNKE